MSPRTQSEEQPENSRSQQTRSRSRSPTASTVGATAGDVVAGTVGVAVAWRDDHGLADGAVLGALTSAAMGALLGVLLSAEDQLRVKAAGLAVGGGTLAIMALIVVEILFVDTSWILTVGISLAIATLVSLAYSDT